MKKGSQRLGGQDGAKAKQNNAPLHFRSAGQPEHVTVSGCAVHEPCQGLKGGPGAEPAPRSAFLLVLGKLKAKKGRKPTGKVPSMNPGPPVERPSVTRRDSVAKTGALTSAAWPARAHPLGERGVFPSGGWWGQVGGREPVLHWAWLALLPRG